MQVSFKVTLTHKKLKLFLMKYVDILRKEDSDLRYNRIIIIDVVAYHFTKIIKDFLSKIRMPLINASPYLP